MVFFPILQRPASNKGLSDIKSVSPIILIGATTILVIAAVVAGFIPARRAASIDPAEVLRME